MQIESVEEIARVEARARAAGREARVGVRINPSVDLAEATHAHIATGHDEAKFGVAAADVGARGRRRSSASPHLELVGHGGARGLAVHVDRRRTSRRRACSSSIVRELRARGRVPALAFVDTGGGFGDRLRRRRRASAGPARLRARRARRAAGVAASDDLALHVEPGRVARRGARRAPRARHPGEGARRPARWLMIDAGMNDLVRPALYQARHRIVPLERATCPSTRSAWRVVGPVCESSDDFGEHLLPPDPPDAVAILDAGAYGYTMASRYNGRQAPAEVFVRGRTRRGGRGARKRRGLGPRADQGGPLTLRSTPPSAWSSTRARSLPARCRTPARTA